MVRIQGPRIVATLAVIAALVTSAQAQLAPNDVARMRSERIAASILRRKTASGVNVRAGNLSVARNAPKPGIEELPPGYASQPILPEDKGLLAPAPPPALQSATDTPPVPSPVAPNALDAYPADSYPVTPHGIGMQPGPITYQNPFSTPVAAPGCDVAGCAVAGCDGTGCAVGPICGPEACGIASCTSCRGYRWIDTFSINVGVLGQKDMVNRGSSGSFGFQEGFNWGSPWVFSPLGMNTQLGFRATQSDFNGSDFTTDERAQFFVTAGFFKRNDCGWQGGFVFDYLHEDWYTTIDLGQLRGELSFAVPNGSSVGMWFATSVTDDDTTSVLLNQQQNESWESHDLYTFFYKVQSNRHRMGQWRVWVGFTGESDGIIGTDFKIPLAGTWSLEPEFTYLIPDEASGAGGQDQEAWNVAFNMVWYPARAMGSLNYRMLPLLDVAGNGSMITRRK